MKKIIAAAAGLFMVGSLASYASAVESQFGGYWRTRAFTQVDFTGKDDGSFAITDTRTRLYYTAVFNENFKFVNKFEFDSTFGDGDGGDLGADGKIFEVKNSYADFNVNNVRFKVGTQGAVINRGFAFDNDFSGVYAGANVGDAALLQFLWVSVSDGDIPGNGVTSTADIPDAEVDYYAFVPVITVNDSLSVTPTLIYGNVEGEDTGVWWAGGDVDYSADAFSLWGTFLYQGGEVDDDNSLGFTLTEDNDISAFLVAAGGSFGMFHGEVFYASGDDDAGDDDIEAFFGAPGGVSYYWSEIMGFGMFDNTASTGAPGDAITNIIAANVGAKTKVSDKLTVGGDLWYAMLAEDDANGEDELGVEVNLKATYMVMENLNLDLVAAYLFAGDATSVDGDNDEDPIEVGARLSLSF